MIRRAGWLVRKVGTSPGQPPITSAASLWGAAPTNLLGAAKAGEDAEWFSGENCRTPFEVGRASMTPQGEGRVGAGEPGPGTVRSHRTLGSVTASGANRLLGGVAGTTTEGR